MFHISGLKMAAKIPEDNKTPYVFLGRSGLKVSNISLGTMTFGENQFGRPGQSDEDLSHQIINRYVEWGSNFLDTANVYGPGNSESIIDKWLENQPRNNFVIATKCGFGIDLEKNVNSVGLSRRHITESIDKSLQRLHTDFVDLYQTHIFDDGTPVEETLRTLDDLVRVGKIRYIGVSNVTGWQLSQLVETTKHLGLNPVISLQQQYSLVCRESELEPFQVCKAQGLGVLTWSPLKGGFLTGEVKRGVKPTKGRIGWVADNEANATQAGPLWKQFDDKSFDVLDLVKAIAKKYSKSVAQVALRWLLQKDVVSSVIRGATSLAELDENMGANGWRLTQEEMKQLDDVSAPQLTYPYNTVFSNNADRVNPTANNFYVKSTSN